MIVYKLGCRWDSFYPLFLDYLVQEKFVIGTTTKQVYRKGDLVLLADGKTVIALASIIDKPYAVTNYPNLASDFKTWQIDYDVWVTIAGAEIIKLREEDQFTYDTRVGMCKVSDSTAKNTAINLWNNYMKEIRMNKIVELLKAKGQIILQGPPGTGKTFNAKQIARQILKPETITSTDIDKLVTKGTIINSATHYTQYTIASVADKVVNVKLSNSASIYPATKTKIVSAYASKLWLGGQVGGNDPYEAAVAKYIYENILLEDQFKIIQFHSAYSYEDFVRGISANSVGGRIEYKTENRVFADLATKAHINYLDSHKSSEDILSQNWILEELQLFGKEVSELIEKNGKYGLNESVSLFDVDEDAFRYTGNSKDTGDRWQVGHMQRMKFQDIVLAYQANAQSRRDIKAIKGISGRAKEHATYDFLLLQKFREFLGNRAPQVSASGKVALKNYVLIIDEINRANLSAVLGELIYAIEYRGERIEGMYEYEGDRGIILPPNLYIIGTMNTADRSVGHMDYAIRRRFAFVDVLPNPEPVKDIAKPLFQAVSKLFVKNFDTLSWVEPKPERAGFLAADFRPEDVWIGHSYFMTKEDGAAGKKELELKLKYEIKPILKEYVKDGILNDHQGQIVLDKIDTLNV